MMNSDYTKSIQKVMRAIEEELDYITVEELIRISGYSYYHFHRIFKAYTGESLKKYMKRLQLEKTLQQMQTNQNNITQIAIKAGYHMSSSFNKAFKEMFGVNPSEYKKQYALKRVVYPTIRPVRIEKIEAIQTYSMRHIGTYENIDTPIEKIVSYAIKNQLMSENFTLLTIPHDNPDVTNEEKLRFDICIKNIKEIDLGKTEWLTKKTISGGKYAVFLHTGNPVALIDVYNSIFGNWLYSSDIILRDEPIFQKFLNNKFEVPEDELLAEVYVPIE